MRQREFAVVRAAQRAGPGIEHLERLHSRVNLRPQVVGDHLGEPIAEAVPRRGLAEHERLGARVAGRGPAFDGVRRQREWRAAKSDERHASGKLCRKNPIVSST